jgi:nucleotide-binding universal stress UspA family protein
MFKILRILVPIDFSKESELALDWAMTVAGKTRGATIYLLHVLPLVATGLGSVAYKKEQEDVERKLTAVQRRIPTDIVSFPIIHRGHIPAAVVQACEEKDIDVVIMTTRGRLGLKHFLTESTTEETIRVAPCPVLVLHLNARNQPQTGKRSIS